MSLELRAATQEDRAFVEAVYFDTQRWIIEALFGRRGDAVERAKFAEFYDRKNTQIFLLDGASIGWWTVIRGHDVIDLGQVYISPKYQRRGIGTLLIGRLIDEAQRERKTLRLSTAKINPALSLYKRLGFAPVSESQFKIVLERRQCPLGG